jgi:threonine aldolase
MLALTKDQVRAVTHMDVSEADIDDALGRIAEVAKARSR